MWNRSTSLSNNKYNNHNHNITLRIKGGDAEITFNQGDQTSRGSNTITTRNFEIMKESVETRKDLNRGRKNVTHVDEGISDVIFHSYQAAKEIRSNDL